MIVGRNPRTTGTSRIQLIGTVSARIAVIFQRKPERGWPPVTRAHFDALLGPTGALLVGDPETVAEKILRVNESLGGISRLTFQMSVADLPHAKLMRAIELIGTRV